MKPTQKNLINLVIIPQLIEMAMNGTLPDDLNQLSAEIFDAKINEFNQSETEIRLDKINTLGNYVCEDPEEAYDKLVNADPEKLVGNVVSFADHCDDFGYMTVDEFMCNHL